MNIDRMVLTLGEIAEYLVERERKHGEDIPTAWISLLVDVQAIITQGEGLTATMEAVAKNHDYCEKMDGNNEGEG